MGKAPAWTVRLVALLALATHCTGCADEALVLTVESVQDEHIGHTAVLPEGELVPGRTLRLDILIENRTDLSVPFNRSFFTLHPRDGFAVRAHYRTEYIDGSCNPGSWTSVELPPRSRLECAVAFVVPLDFVPVALSLYSFATELEACARVPPLPPDLPDAGDG